MKILLTGASGLVGAEVARQAADAKHTVIGLVGKWAGGVPGASELHPVNFTDGDVAREWVVRIKPDSVINAAAIAEPLACETDPVLSHAMNVALPVALAEACAQSGARFVHISSEQVFDGAAPPYSIHSATNPINLYARQKMESEQRVLSAKPAAAIVRAPLLLGNSLSGRRSIHEKLLEQWAAGGVARLYADEFRQVCTAANLATALLELTERRELHGPFHWAGAELCSRYELARRIAARFGVSDAQVASVKRADMPAASAKRPANLGLNLAPLDRELSVRPQTIAVALQELVAPKNFLPWLESLSRQKHG